MNIETIKAHCEKKGYKSRACRFQVIEDLLNITPEEATKVETITRHIRSIFPKDEVGEAKEKEWHTPDYIHQWQNQIRQKPAL